MIEVLFLHFLKRIFMMNHFLFRASLLALLNAIVPIPTAAPTPAAIFTVFVSFFLSSGA